MSLKGEAAQPVDPRVLFFQVSITQSGPRVDGGFNGFYDDLPREKKRAVFYAALHGLLGSAAQMLGDDELFEEIRKSAENADKED